MDFLKYFEYQEEIDAIEGDVKSPRSKTIKETKYNEDYMIYVVSETLNSGVEDERVSDNQKNYWNSLIEKCDKIIVVKDIITLEQSASLHNIIHSFFENIFLPKIKNMKRPIEKYRNVIERKLGRFELNTISIESSIWDILRSNPFFSIINKLIKENIEKNFVKEDNIYCIEELGILPIEPNTETGYWHRDVFLQDKTDFIKKPFYITQIIYLDNKANTEFCIKSRNDSNNNFTKYHREVIEADSCSSVVFDGRHLHRGLANESNSIRYAIYISYYVSSYNIREQKLDKMII